MSWFKGYGKWLLTETGQSFCLGLATAGTIGSFSIYAIPNTICVGYYLDFLHLYKNGVSVPLSETLKKRFEQAVELCEIPEKEKFLYKPFTMCGFDTSHAGTSYSRFGSIIGIPMNFAYNTVKDIDTASIKIKGESVIWDLPEAQKLKESLILSEDAQVFGIAREIEMSRTATLLLSTSLGVLSVFGTYAISVLGNKKLQLLNKPRTARFVFYTLVGAFMTGNYCLVKDFTVCNNEEYVDKLLRDKNPSLAKGGKEFYEKMLLRNRAFRKLLGSEGEKKITVSGNHNYFLRTKHLPLVHRKSFFEAEVAEIEIGTESALS